MEQGTLRDCVLPMGKLVGDAERPTTLRWYAGQCGYSSKTAYHQGEAGNSKMYDRIRSPG